MAKGRGYHLPARFAFDDPSILTKVLPPGAVSRMADWEKLRPSLQSLAGVHIADVDHHVGQKGPSSGPYFPSMLTHGTRYSWSRKRLSIPLEGFGVHGAHVFPACGKYYPTPLLDVLRSLSPREQNHLAGNSLLMPLAAAFVFYCLANLQPIEAPVLLAALGEAGCEDDEEGELLLDDLLRS
jgi:hypothetical protein